MRYEAKQSIVLAFHLVTWPFAVPAWLAYRLRRSEGPFDFGAKALSLVPGKVGQYVRTSFYMQTLDKCHYDFAIAFGSFITHPSARVGRSVVVGSYAIIGNAEIEDRVLIGSRVSVLSGKNHHGSRVLGSVTHKPVFTQVRIGEGSWIGEAAVVMNSIGRECTVAAGSVVTKPAPDQSVAAGNPARFLLLTLTPAVTPIEPQSHEA